MARPFGTGPEPAATAKDFVDGSPRIRRPCKATAPLVTLATTASIKALMHPRASGTGAAVESYVRWVRHHRTHQMLVQEAQEQTGGDPRTTFDYLYRSMDDVVSFGRTAKFDYLTMIGKLQLAPIEPGSTYMQGATGPYQGALLLFGGNARAKLSPVRPRSMVGPTRSSFRLIFRHASARRRSVQLAKESTEIQTFPRLNDTYSLSHLNRLLRVFNWFRLIFPICWSCPTTIPGDTPRVSRT